MEFFKPSISEKNGLDLITKDDINILSIGISTAGSAEIEMSKKSPNSHIIATTIDKNGYEFTKDILIKNNLTNRIELKLEDISQKLPYSNNYFDFIYARLVLHYLNDKQLQDSLSEIYRILKENGKFYVVVRSIDEWEAKLDGTTFDEKTGFTKYPDYKTLNTNNVEYIERRLHSKDSIKHFLTEAGFKIKYLKEYDEYLYRDYKRIDKNPKPNSIIEICAYK
jgi:ubiquinone/menaquinone biosynthesis C-methylase UbiE